MASSNTICRIGVFYDGSFFVHAQRQYYHERLAPVSPLHAFIEGFVAQREQGYASYKVVYAAWHQALFTSKKATHNQLRMDRNLHHDLMHAGIERRRGAGGTSLRSAARRPSSRARVSTGVPPSRRGVDSVPGRDGWSPTRPVSGMDGRTGS